MSPPTYRPAVLEDAELAADLRTAAFPQLPQDPVMTRYRWDHPRMGWSYGRFIAEIEANRPAAFLEWVHGPWDKQPERHGDVEASLDRAFLSIDLLMQLWTWIGESAATEGVRVLTAYAGVDELEVLDVLRRLGYEPEREERVWELDLVKHGPRLVETADADEKSVATQGIRLLTLADWKDADRLRKLHVLNEATIQDIPHTVPILPEPLQHFVERTSAPDRRQDRMWIALDGDRPVAMSYLKFPPVRGKVWTGYTCCDASYRGRGIAQAVKLQTLKQAVALGVGSVYTDNDSKNAPMLHINEQLGYDHIPGWVEHMKRL